MKAERPPVFFDVFDLKVYQWTQADGSQNAIRLEERNVDLEKDNAELVKEKDELEKEKVKLAAVIVELEQQKVVLTKEEVQSEKQINVKMPEHIESGMAADVNVIGEAPVDSKSFVDSIKGLEDQNGVHGQIAEVDEENEQSMGHNQPPAWWKGAMSIEREKFTEELNTMLSSWSSSMVLDRMR